MYNYIFAAVLTLPVMSNEAVEYIQEKSSMNPALSYAYHSVFQLHGNNCGVMPDVATLQSYEKTKTFKALVGSFESPIGITGTESLFTKNSEKIKCPEDK